MSNILDHELQCPYCGTIVTVGNAEPDIDGDGNLGCPFCLTEADRKIVLEEIVTGK